jgi:hypothetical protein
MRCSLILAGVGRHPDLAASVASPPVRSRRKVQDGVLECRGGASVGFIVGSVTNLGCVLRTAAGPTTSMSRPSVK